MKYAEHLLLALAAVDRAFEHNEEKYGEGLKFKTVDHETIKCRSHIMGHDVINVVNKEDNCLHLTSAACRALKALQLFLQENPDYIYQFVKPTEKGQQPPEEEDPLMEQLRESERVEDPPLRCKVDHHVV